MIFKLVYRIFGHEGSAADDILYVNWLNMVRAGILGLEFFTPESKTWRQVGHTDSSAFVKDTNTHTIEMLINKREGNLK